MHKFWKHLWIALGLQIQAFPMFSLEREEIASLKIITILEEIMIPVIKKDGRG